MYYELARTANEVVETLVGEFNCSATDIITKAEEIKAELLTLTAQLEEEKRVSTETRAEVSKDWPNRLVDSLVDRLVHNKRNKKY